MSAVSLAELARIVSKDTRAIVRHFWDIWTWLDMVSILVALASCQLCAA